MKRIRKEKKKNPQSSKTFSSVIFPFSLFNMGSKIHSSEVEVTVYIWVCEMNFGMLEIKENKNIHCVTWWHDVDEFGGINCN